MYVSSHEGSYGGNLKNERNNPSYHPNLVPKGMKKCSFYFYWLQHRNFAHVIYNQPKLKADRKYLSCRVNSKPSKLDCLLQIHSYKGLTMTKFLRMDYPSNFEGL